MKRYFVLAVILLFVASLIPLVAAGQGMAGGTVEKKSTINVAAAADLQFAFTEISELFQRETGHKVVLVFGSTGILAKQIENGAPIDVFAAANTEFVDDLRQKDRIIANSQQLYSIGRIALIGGKSSRVLVSDISDLTNPDVKKIAIANPEHAPYGAAAKQALEASAVWEQVKSKLVFGENVRQALQYVQTGNAEAGIVAISIANAPEIDFVLINDGLYQPLRQSIAVVKGSKQEQVSREFISFINSSKGRPIMKKYGFLLPGES